MNLTIPQAAEVLGVDPTKPKRKNKPGAGRKPAHGAPRNQLLGIRLTIDEKTLLVKTLEEVRRTK